MSVTLKQIARDCNLDISTVSKALRGNPMINEQTRERIQRVADELGYAPNPAARSLVGAHSQTIWFIMGTTEDILYVPIAEAASIGLAKHGYDLLLAMHHGDEKAYRRLAARLLQGMADGAIVAPRHQHAGDAERTRQALEPVYKRGIPLVFLDQNIEGWNVPVVTTDNAPCTAELIRTCAEHGVKEFYLLFTQVNNVERERCASAVHEVERLGLHCNLPLQHPSDNKRDDERHKREPAAVISSAQQNIADFANSHPQILNGRTIFFGCFDQWHGIANPAEKIFIVNQNLTALAENASSILMQLIDKKSYFDDFHELVRIPAAGIETLTAFDTAPER